MVEGGGAVENARVYTSHVMVIMNYFVIAATPV
jgi:hypothetical protein